MTEKRGQKTERYAKPCHWGVTSKSSMPISGIILLRFKLPLGSFAAPLRSLNFVTFCPSDMYFLLYSTLKSVFVDKFGYPCTIDVIFDLEKKN